MNSNWVDQGRRSRWRWGLWVAVGMTVGGLAATVGWAWWGAGQRPSEDPVITAPALNTVTALGRLQPEGEVINLMAPTTAQETRLATLLVAAGDRVEAGQVIAILDNRDGLQATVVSAEEQVRVARARLAQVQAGVEPGTVQAQGAEIDRLQADGAGSIASQRATVQRLQAEAAVARTDAERFDALYQQGAVSAAERDSRALAYETTQQQVTAAEAELTRLQTTYPARVQQATATLTALASVPPVDVAVAEAELAAAIATLREAEIALEQAYIKAPQAGQVLKVHTRPGETIAPEGIVTLGATQQMVAIAEVYQSDIHPIQVGQSVTVTSPVVPGALTGVVDHIGLQVEAQQVVDEDPAANIDAKVIEVQVRLTPEASERVASLSNLQVTVTIHLEGARP